MHTVSAMQSCPQSMAAGSRWVATPVAALPLTCRDQLVRPATQQPCSHVPDNMPGWSQGPSSWVRTQHRRHVPRVFTSASKSHTQPQNSQPVNAPAEQSPYTSNSRARRPAGEGLAGASLPTGAAPAPGGQHRRAARSSDHANDSSQQSSWEAGATAAAAAADAASGRQHAQHPFGPPPPRGLPRSPQGPGQRLPGGRSNSSRPQPGNAAARQGSQSRDAAAHTLTEQLEGIGFSNVPAGWVHRAVSTPGFQKSLRVPQARSAQQPRLPHIIIVEGPADAAVVQRTVQALVYICDGSSIKSDAAAGHLEVLAQWPGGVVVLMDPDAPGRELRMFLDEWLVQRRLAREGTKPTRVTHAFVPVEQATAVADTKWHEEGSTGIENASPAAVIRSLKQRRPSFPDSRKEFSVAELQERGLVNTFDQGKQVNGAKLRRKLLCDSLGIDNCTGKSLTTMLNRFFTRDEFEAAFSLSAQANGQE